MGRSVQVAARKGGSRGRPNEEASQELDLGALRQTPGFMIRILQIQIFERFFDYFAIPQLSPVDYAILVTVRDNPTVTQSQLAGVLRMQLPNLVKILSRMEDEGTLKRKRSIKDKRAVELSLTASGRARADEANKLGDAFNAQTLAALSKPEQAEFLRMLARLVERYERTTMRS
jgi:DNA-binding MarR family transcriptional regulator